MNSSSVTLNDAEVFEKFVHNINGTVESESPDFRLKYPAKKSMVVFISSTFTDTFRERNILLENILPKLQVDCNIFHIRVVLIDMRYGVRDENTNDHMTWVACERELLRCYRESGSIAFLSLQGNKYGYRPIPKQIDKELFEKRIRSFPEMKNDFLDIVTGWYHLDLNSFLPVYELRKLTIVNKQGFWDNAFFPLRDLFRDMPFSDDNPDLIIDRSITEYETRKALSLSSNSKYSRMYWLHRQFTGGVTEAQDPRHNYCDLDGLVLRKKMDTLLSIMTSELSPENRIRDFHLPFESYINNDDICNAYLNDWEEKAYKLLHEQLDLVIQNRKSWEIDGYGAGSNEVTGLVLEEFLHHVRWANLKCSTFLGRDRLLLECVSKVYEISNKSDENIDDIIQTPSFKFQGICLSVIGVSGCGKTALMSKLAQVISERDKVNGFDRPVIIRFCGTTADSSNGLSLIHSISYQIRYLYKDTNTTPQSSDYDIAVEYFQSLLAEYPVVLLIDSLDQLTNANEARSKISFLVGVRPHINTRIIVSCLPDEKGIDGSWKYCYLCDTRLKEAEVARVAVPQLDVTDDDISDMMVTLLAANKRRVTEDQLSFALQQVTVESTALYVQLATRIMLSWRSYDAIDSLMLQPTVVGIINQIIDGLEREFGRELTRCALGLMTFAVAGINDNEMQDLLSLDDAVMESVFQYWQLETKRLPLHVWLRLRGALEGLVVERESGCLVWYHRQLKETAESRYSKGEKKHLHGLLGSYFADVVDFSVKKARLIASQPLTWTETRAFSSDCVINHRRCVEGSYHLCQAGLLTEAVNELCSFEMICACAKIGVGYSLLDNILNLHNLLMNAINMIFKPNNDINNLQRRVSHYLYWLRREMSSIIKNPVRYISVTITTSQPMNSIVSQDFNEYLSKYRKQSSNYNIDSLQYWSSGWVVGRSLGTLIDFDNILLSLTGHAHWVNSAEFSPDGHTIVSGSTDFTVKVWEVKTGSIIQTYEGHCRGVTSVSFSPDGITIVSGAWDNTVKLWDLKTGVILLTMEGHSDAVTSVCFSPDSQTIVSGSRDNTIKVWDIKSNSVLYTCEGHSDAVKSVCFSPNGKTLASGSEDKTVKLWDASTGGLLHTYEGHSEFVSSVDFSPDGQNIVSGSHDNTLRLWDVDKGNVLFTYEGHTNWVYSVSFSLDGQTVVSGSYDTTVRLWDVKTGTLLNTYNGHSNEVNSVCFSPDGQAIVSASWDNTVKVWNVTSSNNSNKIDGHVDMVTSVSISPDSQNVVSGSRDNKVKLWNIQTGSLLHTYEGHINWITSVCFSPDGRTIASGSFDNKIIVWDFRDRRMLRTYEGHISGVSSVCFSPDCQAIVSGSYEDGVKVWDIKTGNVLHTYYVHSGWVTSVRFSPDGQSIVTGSEDTTIILWDIKSETILHKLTNHANLVNTVDFSPDGCSIVSASDDGTVKVWDIKTGNLLHTYEGHVLGVYSASFSPDGQTIVSGSDDKTIKIWNVKTCSVMHTFDGHSGGVTAVSLSSDGLVLVSGSVDKTVKVWDVRSV